MLVLSRKHGEKIQVGNDFELIVVDISSKRVRLGINCPHQIPIHREEVYRRICSSWQAASDGRADESRFHVEFA